MKTFEEIVKDETGTIYEDFIENGIRCIVLRGPASLCAYLGIPKNHPLANKNYNDLPLDVHCGLTFGKLGDGKYLPKGLYWYGWDYAHLGDYCFYYLDPKMKGCASFEGKKWVVEQVKDEVKFAAWDFKKLMILVEKRQRWGWLRKLLKIFCGSKP